MIRTAKLYYIKSLLIKSNHSPKSAAALWSTVYEVIGRHQPHKSSLGSDLSLETINDFFVLWLFPMNQSAAYNKTYIQYT